jgi:L-lysine 2,3-aminomutase
MIAHLVLFSPKASLSAREREDTITALERACFDIPQIKRVRVGRRRLLGHAYDALAPVHFEYAVIMEFESPADLDAYLQHPAHVALGHHFNHSAEVALALDFAIGDASQIQAIAALDAPG